MSVKEAGASESREMGANAEKEVSYTDSWTETHVLAWLHGGAHVLLILFGVIQAAVSVLIMTTEGAPRGAYHGIAAAMGLLMAAGAGALLGFTFRPFLTVLVQAISLIVMAIVLLVFNCIYTSFFGRLPSRLGVSCSALPSITGFSTWETLLASSPLNAARIRSVLREQGLLETNAQAFCSRSEVFIVIIWLSLAMTLATLLILIGLVYLATFKGIVLRRLNIPMKNILTDVPIKQCPQTSRRLSTLARINTGETTLHSMTEHNAFGHKQVEKPDGIHHAHAYAYDQPLPGFYAAGMIHEGYMAQCTSGERPLTAESNRSNRFEPWVADSVIVDPDDRGPVVDPVEQRVGTGGSGRSNNFI